VRLVSEGPVVVVGTCDAARVPDVSRGWGFRVSPAANGIDVCVYDASAGRALANLTEHAYAAVTVTSPTTYRSFQVKGRALVSDCDNHDAERVADHQRRFVEAVASIGLQADLAVRFFEQERNASSTMKRIHIELEALFDQTPGPGAGTRL